MTDLLTVKKLSLQYGAHSAVYVEHLVIPAQGCLVLSGENGSGKTSILKILAGLIAPTSAQFSWQNQAYTWKKIKPILRNQVVYLHQHPYLFDMNVAENIAYGLRQQGINKQHITEKVKEALAWANLTHLAERSAKCLSGGEKQRVALTRARVLSPRLLLLDEPTSSMDQQAKAQTYDLIRRLRTEALSIVLTSHEITQADGLGDHYFTLQKKEIVSNSLATQPSTAQQYHTA